MRSETIETEDEENREVASGREQSSLTFESGISTGRPQTNRMACKIGLIGFLFAIPWGGWCQIWQWQAVVGTGENAQVLRHVAIAVTKHVVKKGAMKNLTDALIAGAIKVIRFYQR